MGLVEISEKMTTSVTIPTSSSKNPGSSNSSMNTTPTSSTSPDQVVRKKRTFDIAFLTGQSESENVGDNLDRESPKYGNTGPCSTSNNNNNERKCAVNIVNVEQHQSSLHRTPYNPKDEDGTNSDSSSIDVMTNGSLSESESQHSPSSSIPERASPPFHPMLLIHHHHQLSRANGPSTPYPGSNGNTSAGSSSHHRSTSHNSSYDHHHHHNFHHGDIKNNRSSSPPRVSSNGNKTRNNRSPVKEEIRFESRRIIDINQTVDSLKIKENLQFSTLLPSSATLGLNLPNNGGNGGGGASERADLTLPHLASTIALLPHVARFPLGLPSLASGVIPGGNHVAKNLPFHAKMEKSESINISYPKLRGGTFPDPYAVLAASASSCGYPYPNLGLSPELVRHPSFPNPMGSPGGAAPGEGSAPRGMGSPGSSGQQVSSSQPPPSQPPPPVAPNSSVSPCGMSPSATLLPPSLTALTLPAQNVCAKCNIGFRMTSDLVYHMRSHHKRDTDPMKKQREEKLKCPVCHETFRERHHLTRHMTAHQDRAEET